MRLRRSDCSGPGITRVGRGRGFEYREANGSRIANAALIERIRALAIPPAWRDVWICPQDNGHIQATGIDDAGRKQYRYHDHWRDRRDRAKFDSMLEFARGLPRLRRRVGRDLGADGMQRARALACAVRILDQGSLRIGSESYAEDNDSYGLATIRRDHVEVSGPEIRLDYSAKGGAQRVQTIRDAGAARTIRDLKRRRGGGEELLAFKEGARWRDVKSADINEYLKAVLSSDHSAKDFRTWNATVLAAAALASLGPDQPSKTARKRAIRTAVELVSEHLGNTPAVCRASYIDPRVFDRFEGGVVVDCELPGDLTDPDRWPRARKSLERAVLTMLEDD